jgi:hypothetical protein
MIRGETPLNPYKTDSGAVGQRFEFSRAHHLSPEHQRREVLRIQPDPTWPHGLAFCEV